MDDKTRVIIDAGHGGEYDPGAVFEGRKEKDDNLRLALAVGELLAKQGVEVFYTRVTDVYDSPYEKAAMGNESEADIFLSLHRNAARIPGNGSGTMSLVYQEEGKAGDLARSINRQLREMTGFTDLGVFSRPDLIVLRETQMPAVLVEAGFLDNPEDNRRFDEEFDQVAAAIAQGVLHVIRGEETVAGRPQEAAPGYFYLVQTGVYRVRALAEQQLEELKRQGYPAFLTYDGTYYRVMAGAFRELDNAARQEQELRRKGYSTLLVYEKEKK